MQDRERIKIQYSPVAFFMEALTCILSKVLVMRLEQETKYTLEVSEISRFVQSFELHMNLTVTENIVEKGTVKSNIGAFEVLNVFQPERCVFIEGRRVDINMVRRLFEEDKTRLLLKMITFKIDTSALIDGQLFPEEFKRNRWVQI
jgi:hypothetical protein